MTTLRLYIYGIGASVVPGRSIHFNIDINDERNLIAIKTLAENPGANPRTSDLTSSVARAIENSLASNPLYGETTNGISAVVSDFKMGQDTDGSQYCDITFDLEDEDEGQFNGAHNLWLILQYMKKTLGSNPGQFLPAQFILDSAFDSREQIRELANNKNRQVGIDSVSELNVLGYFEDLKASLPPEMVKYIAWEQNEKKVGSTKDKKLDTVAFKEVLQIMELMMYHYPTYSQKQKGLINFNPEVSRKRIGAAPAEYFEPEATKTLAMAKTFGVTGDLLLLRDFVVEKLDSLALKDDSLIILRNLARSSEKDPANKFRAVLGGMGKTTVRTTGYFSRPDEARYSTCPSFHRLFLYWFVKKCFAVNTNTDELEYRDHWDLDLMQQFLDFSYEKVTRALDALYRGSWAENSMTEENWLIQKYVNHSTYMKPFDMANTKFDECYKEFLNQLSEDITRRGLKRVEKSANG
tara:strand:- start:334 stop:1731 length:1398 start_codon:yes stop_codon:yes gene_type:complete